MHLTPDLQCSVQSVGPNASQIRWSAYAYVAYHFEIKKNIYVLLQKSFNTYFLNCFIKFHAFSDAEKFQENSYLEKKFVQRNFQTATASLVF